MYYHRNLGAMKEWSTEEIAILQEHYVTMSLPELMALLPERTLYSIRCFVEHHLDLPRRQYSGTFGISLNDTHADREFMKNRGIQENVSYTNWEVLY